MHEHDTDLIMALAERSLGEEDTAVAAAEIGACSQCSEHLALQIVALDAIAAAPESRLNEFESARIRRNIRRELGIGEDAPATTRRRRFLPAAVLGGAAAVLLAVVVAGGALQNLGGGDAESIASADFAATTSTAAATRDVAEAPLAAESGTAMADEAGEDAQSEVEAASAPTTTAGLSAPAVDLVPVVAGSSDLPALRDLVIDAAGEIDQVRMLSRQLQPEAAGLAQSGETDCGIESAEQLGAVDSFTVAVGAIDDNDVVVVAYITDPVDGTVVIAHDAVTCESVARAP